MRVTFEYTGLRGFSLLNMTRKKSRVFEIPNDMEIGRFIEEVGASGLRRKVDGASHELRLGGFVPDATYEVLGGNPSEIEGNLRRYFAR